MRALLALLLALAFGAAAEASESALLHVAPAGMSAEWRANGVILDGEPPVAAAIIDADWANQPLAATLPDGRALAVLDLTFNAQAGVAMLRLGGDAPTGRALATGWPARDVSVIGPDGVTHRGTASPARAYINPLINPLTFEFVPFHAVMVADDGDVAGLVLGLSLSLGGLFGSPAAVLARLREDFLAGLTPAWGRIGFSVVEGATGPAIHRIYEPGLVALIRPGDEIGEVDGAPILDAAHFRRAILLRRPGAMLDIALRRDGAPIRATLRVAAGDASSRRGVLGLWFAEATPGFMERHDWPAGFNGVIVTSVSRTYTALGFRVLDRLVAFDGRPVSDVDDAMRVLETFSDARMNAIWANAGLGDITDAMRHAPRVATIERDGRLIDLELSLE